MIKFIDKTEEKVFVDRLREIDWVYWLNRPYRVFFGTVFWVGVREEVFERTGFAGIAPGNHLFQSPDLYQDKKFKERALIYFDKFFQSHQMSELSDRLEEMHRHHLIELKKTTVDKSKTIPEKAIIMSELIQDYIPFLWLISGLESHFDRIIAEEVPKYISGDYSKFVGDISIPTKKNVHVLMLEEIKSGVSAAEIKDKYGWMKSRDGFTDFYTEEEIEEIRSGIKEEEKGEVSIPQGLAKLAEDLKELNFYRTSRTDKLNEYLGAARPLMEEIAKSIGISFKELADYDANSIILGKPRKFDKNFSCGLIGDEYLVSDNKLIDFAVNRDQEIKGNIAFKGLVRGIAKIVVHPDDLVKVKTGEVLVAQMTFPSFISAMQKSVAFVTDEGSIACHAAIIAREMKKPCIVGTKNATKILKDGDLIEVDAEKGMVRKIN